MIQRTEQVATVRRLLRDFPVVAIVGARQVGKTTLARQLAGEAGADRGSVFDLESPRDLARLDDPMRALQERRGLVVLDEIQRLPEVFPVLRVLADRPRRPARFLVLGSASPDLPRPSSESLAGRIAYHETSRLETVSLETIEFGVLCGRRAEFHVYERAALRLHCGGGFAEKRG